MEQKVMVIGALGQIGSELVPELQSRYGKDNVLATDKRPVEHYDGHFEALDIIDAARLRQLIEDYRITQVYHMVAMLSATAEKMPMKGWDLNMGSLFNVLELAKEGLIQKVFWPSSIAAFGPNTPKEATPQYTVMDPTTVYGISKLSGELWCDYYHKNYGVDVRGVRYPGIISYKTEPGGGTTDYAIDIFKKAVRNEEYQCYLSEERALPMMYMPDAVKATIELMEAPEGQVKIRTSYNIGAFSFTPESLSAAICKHKPEFSISYKLDERDKYAANWPQSIDDAEARNHWKWKPDYSLDDMVKEMLKNVS